jgi:hypothetical protein
MPNFEVSNRDLRAAVSHSQKKEEKEAETAIGSV